MGSILSRLLTVIIGVAGSAVASFFLMQSWKMLGEMPATETAQHGAPAEHGAAPAHGEAPADAHGAPAGHGAPEAGHGAPAADAHGAPAARETAAADKNAAVGRTWVSMEQMFVNLAGPENDGHSLTFQVEVELFDESKRSILESRLATLKNAAIEIARDQSFERLKTLSGKLYFKEALVTAMNETMHAPVIRDIHVSSIFLK